MPHKELFLTIFFSPVYIKVCEVEIYDETLHGLKYSCVSTPGHSVAVALEEYECERCPGRRSCWQPQYSGICEMGKSGIRRVQDVVLQNFSESAS